MVRHGAAGAHPAGDRPAVPRRDRGIPQAPRHRRAPDRAGRRAGTAEPGRIPWLHRERDRPLSRADPERAHHPGMIWNDAAVARLPGPGFARIMTAGRGAPKAARAAGQGGRTMSMHFNLTAVAAVAVTVAMATPASAQGNTQGITDTTIKIGSLGPFSGESTVFNPLNYGPEAYLRAANAAGGVHGRKFETVFADDACNEAKGIAAAKKLIYEDKVFMIMGHPCSGVAMAIKPMLEQEGVPWMGLSANPKITTPTVPAMFAAGYTGAASGAAMAGFALSKPGVKKIALA